VTERFRHILAVCDQTEADTPLVEFAADLAQRLNAELTLLAVVEPPADLPIIARLTGTETGEIEARLVADCERHLADLAGGTAAGARAELAVDIDKPFVAILRRVLGAGADLVVKTASPLHNRFPLLASTDQHLLRKCPCPVWLRRHGAPGSAGTVLAAVDVDDSQAAEPATLAALNRRIVQAALQAAGTDGTVHLLHVWDAPGEGLLRMVSGNPDPSAAVARYRRGVLAAHREGLDRLVAEARASMAPAERVELLPRLVQGTPSAVVPEQARLLCADTLVMGTVARVGIPGLLIGNTAEDTLNQVTCSVLTVKPPDFECPLRLD